MKTVGVLLFALLSLLAAPTPAPAQGDGNDAPPLTLQFRQAISRSRTAGPLPVEAELAWHGQGLLRGRLELSFHNGWQTVATHQTPDLALVTGRQTLRLLLPPMEAPHQPAAVTVRARFRSGRNAIRLPDTVLYLSSADERSLVVAAVSATQGYAPHASELYQSLHLETYHPPEPENTTLQTTVARLEADQLPADPLGFCAFNVVLLDSEALAVVEPAKLKRSSGGSGPAAASAFWPTAPSHRRSWRCSTIWSPPTRRSRPTPPAPTAACSCPAAPISASSAPASAGWSWSNRA